MFVTTKQKVVGRNQDPHPCILDSVSNAGKIESRDRSIYLIETEIGTFIRCKADSRLLTSRETRSRSWQ